MDEQRIQAYLSLIQELFSCPRGEEGRILREHLDLIDEGFFLVGAQVAQQLQEAGQEQQALFLVGLLAQIIDAETPTSNSEPRIDSEPRILQESEVLDTAATFPDGFPRNPQEAVTASEALSPTEKEEWYEWLQTATPEQKAELVDILHSMWQQAQASATISSSETPTSSSEPRILQESGVLGSSATPQEYLRFLQELLQTEMENFGSSDPRPVFQVLATHRDKIDLTFAQILKQWADQIITENPETAESIAALIENVSIRISDFPLGNRANNLEVTIAGYEIVLSVRTRDNNAEKWAQTQNNLANAYQSRIRGERAENLEKAIAAYEQALLEYTREAFPEKWAMTQNNLGTAYKNRIRGERAENLENAIAAYEQALLEYTREAFPEDWAGTQNNLGAAYSNRIRGERAENLEMAIAAYEQALLEYTREAFPEKWAMTQNNLAVAYSNRIRGERAENLEIAIAAYEQALLEYTREAFPEKWAMTQNNLAVAYSNRIRGERAENLEKAIAAYERALLEYTREAFPEDWAMTQNNLGTAYSNRIRGERAENLEKAIAAYERALLEYTREAFPEDWAMTQNNLGTAYSDRIRGERAENLEIAIAAYEAALQVRTREAFPEDWASTQNNLGTAYSNRIRGERAENLEKAIATYEQALQVRTREAFPEKWAMTQNNLGTAYKNRIRGERAENLENAIAAYEQALLEYTREAFPEDWAETQHNLATAYIDLKDNNKAIQYLKAALDVFTPATLPLSCLKTGRNLGNLAYDLQAWETACFGYDNAIRAVEQSRNWATSPQSKQKILADALPLYGRMVAACLHLDRYDQALLTIERSKSRTLIELLNQADLVPKNATPDQQQRYRQLSREITALQQAFEGEAFLNDLTEDGENRHSPQTVTTAPQNNPLQTLLSQREALLAEINDPDFNELVSVRPQLPDFSKLLTPTTALIEWYLPPDPDLGAYAFVVTLPDNQPHIQLHSYTASQRQALDAFNQAYFADFRQTSWYNTLASRLRDLAQILDLASLVELLPQPCHSLILIPHLYLHLFPLHALPVVTNSETLPWQETVSTGIRYAPSSQILDYIHHRPQTTTAEQFFAIQNPTEDLPYTDLEIDTIRRNFDPNSYILSHAKATKTALNAAENLAQLRQSHLIHFACHGGFDSENPLNSALILAGDTASPPQEGRSLTLRDGRRFDTSQQGLTLREIYANLELRACRLVILSACETGLLSSQLTDEYIGLASGFLYAGSPSVISSLWCVDDFATAFLTIRFYQEFTPTTPTAQAAKAAQAWMRQVSQVDFLKWLQDDLKLPEKAFRNCQLRLRRRYKTNPPFSDPKYWSAFGAIGL